MATSDVHREPCPQTLQIQARCSPDPLILSRARSRRASCGIGGNENEAQSALRQKLTAKGPTLRGTNAVTIEAPGEFFERSPAV